MHVFVMWVLGLTCGVFTVLGITAGHSSNNLIGKDRADLLLMKETCERELTRDRQCIARVEFVPETKAP